MCNYKIYKSFTFTNWYTYLLILESTKIYIKIYTKMLLHVSVFDHHQGSLYLGPAKVTIVKIVR